MLWDSLDSAENSICKTPDNRFIIDAIAASNMRTSIYAQYPELAKFKLEKILYPNGAKMGQRFLA